MDVTEEKFKLALATDLVIYMIQVLIQNSSSDPIELVDSIMNTWSQRVENSAKFMKQEIAKQMVEKAPELTEDVAMLLLDVNNIENKMMKGEFKTQMREAIYKGIAAQKR